MAIAGNKVAALGRVAIPTPPIDPQTIDLDLPDTGHFCGACVRVPDKGKACFYGAFVGATSTIAASVSLGSVIAANAISAITIGPAIALLILMPVAVGAAAGSISASVLYCYLSRKRQYEARRVVPI